MSEEAAKDGSAEVETKVEPVSEGREAAAPVEKEEKEVKHRSIRTALSAEFKKAKKDENAAKKGPEKPEIEAKPATAAPSREAPIAATTEAAKEPAPAADDYPIVPPASMSAREKELFAQASPELKQFLSRREHEVRSELKKQSDQIRQAATHYQGIDSALQPHRDYLSKYQISPAAAINSAIAWDKSFRQDRLGAAKEFLDAYGIDPRELVGDGTQAAPAQRPQQQAPQGNFMTREDFEGWQRSQQQNRIVNDAAAAVESFTKDKPVFRDPATREQFEAEMVPIVHGLLAQNPSLPHAEALSKAYEFVSSTPRWSPYTQTRAAADKAKAEAAQATQASRTVKGGSGLSGTPAKKPTTRREALSLAIRGEL